MIGKSLCKLHVLPTFTFARHLHLQELTHLVSRHGPISAHEQGGGQAALKLFRSSGCACEGGSHSQEDST